MSLIADPTESLADETVARIEGHEFDSVKVLQWRSRRLDFSSIHDLHASLETAPQVPGLTKALPAVDQRALEFLSRDAAIRDICKGPEEVALLWDACVLPDYRKQGIARMLISAVEQVAIESQFPKMELGVRLILEGNQRLFKSLGFEITEAHSHEGYSETTWYTMVKRL